MSTPQTHTATASVDATQRRSLWESHHMQYLGIAYGFTWVFWIGAWVIARTNDSGEVLINEDLVWGLLFSDEPFAQIVTLSILSAIGVWGPMLAGIIATRLDPDVNASDLLRRVRNVGIGARWYGLVLGILVLVAGPAFLIVSATAQAAPDAPSGGTLGLFLLVFFVFQMLTSGTEEIGWRGYLNEKLRHGRDFWDTGWAVGIPWAVWHFPIVVIMFVQQGLALPAIVGNLAGFSISIIAASILHAWFYEKTESVFLNIFIHASFNTLPLATALLYEDSPVAVISNLALWAVVVLIKRRHDRSLAADETIASMG